MQAVVKSVSFIRQLFVDIFVAIILQLITGANSYLLLSLIYLIYSKMAKRQPSFTAEEVEVLPGHFCNC